MDSTWIDEWKDDDGKEVHGVMKRDEYESRKPLPEGSAVIVVPGMMSEDEWEAEYGPFSST